MLEECVSEQERAQGIIGRSVAASRRLPGGYGDVAAHRRHPNAGDAALSLLAS